MAWAERTPHATWASSGAGDEAHAAVGQKYALLLLCFKVRHVFSGRVKGKGKARNRSAPCTSLQHLPGPWAPSSPLTSLRAPPSLLPASRQRRLRGPAVQVPGDGVDVRSGPQSCSCGVGEARGPAGSPRYHPMTSPHGHLVTGNPGPPTSGWFPHTVHPDTPRGAHLVRPLGSRDP